MIDKPQIEKLEWCPGDIVVVKLGDHKTGMIPSPDRQNQFLALWRRLCDEMDLDIPILIWDSAIAFEVLHVQRPAKED